jgi:hypothetical protein
LEHKKNIGSEKSKDSIANIAAKVANDW